VNAVVITAFLVMGLLANTLMIFRQVSIRLSYILLFALLGLDLFLTYSGFAALPGGIRVVTAAVFAALPIFFSGLIFSRAFRDVAQPGEALGVNLMGAVIGGTLENSVMLGGTPVLGVLAILLYFLSALSLRRRRSVATV